MTEQTRETWKQVEKTVRTATKRLESEGRSLAKRLEGEGRKVAKEAKSRLAAAEDWRKEIDGKLEELRSQIVAAVGLATRSDIDKLQKKLAALSKRLDTMGKSAN